MPSPLPSTSPSHLLSSIKLISSFPTFFFSLSHPILSAFIIFLHHHEENHKTDSAIVGDREKNEDRETSKPEDGSDDDDDDEYYYEDDTGLAAKSCLVTIYKLHN
ncbi:uncharacterized protein [Rutidosis leptorrhynchoides]|uniref:uncharacterized protein n=1 Tax=Rutidosis leptorrhynchoides TaxID=125765 RepID=UPI003A991779